MGASFAYAVVLAVGFLLFVQIRCVLTNKTAIEDYICMNKLVIFMHFIIVNASLQFIIFFYYFLLIYFFLQFIIEILGKKAEYRNREEPFIFPYDLGRTRNFKEVCYLYFPQILINLF
jgi:hypothetical protein